MKFLALIRMKLFKLPRLIKLEWCLKNYWPSFEARLGSVWGNLYHNICTQSLHHIRNNTKLRIGFNYQQYTQGEWFNWKALCWKWTRGYQFVCRQNVIQQIFTELNASDCAVASVLVWKGAIIRFVMNGSLVTVSERWIELFCCKNRLCREFKCRTFVKQQLLINL